MARLTLIKKGSASVLESTEVLIALTIFGLRVFNYAVSTFRLVTISRGRRFISALLAALEALIFAVVIAEIVTDLENLLNLLAYCAGAAVGSYVGMLLETRFITSFSVINVIANAEAGQRLAAALREAGFGVTTLTGEGRDGAVIALRTVVNKREAKLVHRTVREVHPEAFVTVEEANAVQQGWVRLKMPGRDKRLR